MIEADSKESGIAITPVMTASSTVPPTPNSKAAEVIKTPSLNNCFDLISFTSRDSLFSQVPMIESEIQQAQISFIAFTMTIII